MEAKIRKVFSAQPGGARDGSQGKMPALDLYKMPVVDWPRRGQVIRHV
jgi:hypothetical protein